MVPHKVFITTNAKQRLGALISKFTIERYSRNLDKFSIEIIDCDNLAELKRLYGATYVREGKKAVFSSNDLQTFTLTRFMPPELMGYVGRSLVIDPDIFATFSDVWDLLGRDMQDAAILSRRGKENDWATSVMVLDNSKLKHWSLNNIVTKLLANEIDYRDQMNLRLEKVKISEISEEWNSFDKLNSNTKLLHNTQRNTQPWRVGLQIEYTPKKMKPVAGIIPREWVHTLIGKNPYIHREHPDPNQTQFFFGQLKAAIEAGKIDESIVRDEIKLNHVRKDAFKVLETTKPL